jgi:hypothetical protein
VPDETECGIEDQDRQEQGMLHYSLSILEELPAPYEASRKILRDADSCTDT